MRVMVYRNLHKALWSIMALEGPEYGRVIDRSDTVLLRDVTARVRESGRLKVIAENRKNVHAGIIGQLESTEPQPWDGGARVTYNPMTDTTFVYAGEGEERRPFEAAPRCYFDEHGKVYVQTPDQEN